MGVFVLSVILILSGAFMLHYVKKSNNEIKKYQRKYSRCLRSYEKIFWKYHAGEEYIPHESWDENPRNPIEAHEKSNLAEMYIDTIKQGERELMLSLWNTSMTQYYNKMNSVQENSEIDSDSGLKWYDSMSGENIIFNIAAHRN